MIFVTGPRLYWLLLHPPGVECGGHAHPTFVRVHWFWLSGTLALRVEYQSAQNLVKTKNGQLASLPSNPLVTVPILELWAKWVKVAVLTVSLMLLECTKTHHFKRKIHFPKQGYSSLPRPHLQLKEETPFYT